jgi:hypothetical protein
MKEIYLFISTLGLASIGLLNAIYLTARAFFE